jgi:hypothetical protein
MFHNNEININNPAKTNDLGSRPTSPNYNHMLTWKLKGDEEIDPTTLFIIKVETLEIPSLKATVVGYAFLNLFIDESDLSPRQPKDDNKSSNLFLNGGQFELSIYYGNIPKYSSLNVELIEKDYMNKIPNAVLYVRILDPTNKIHEKKNSSCIKEITASMKKNTICDSLNFSTETKLVNAYLNLPPFIVQPPMPLELKSHYTAMKDHQSRGGQVDLTEFFREQSEVWINSVFRDNASNWPISSSSMLPYNDENGLFCALDFLYNLPKLSQSSTSSKDSKKNIIHGYKATFSYLSGKSNDANEDNWVEDDCTTEWDFDAPEACPSYDGEMFRVSDFGLTENACILIVVTAVNIITDDSKAEKPQKNEASNKTPPAGVKGLEIFYLDPTATWYGLLKVRKDHVDGKNNFFVDGGTHQVPLMRGIPPDSIVTAKDPYQLYINMIDQRTRFQKTKYEEMKKKSSSCCFNAAVLPDIDDDPSVPKMIFKDGASAFIRIADGRLKSFHDKHIFKDPSIILQQPCLLSVLKAASCDKDGKDTDTKHRKILDDLFRYDAMKHDDTRRLKDALPKQTDKNELIKYINEEYRKHVENS